MNTGSLTKSFKLKGDLANITEAQQEQLAGWLNSTRTYKAIMELVETNFKISLKSRSALKQFRKRLREAALLQQQKVFCPPHVPRDVWEASLGEMVKVLRSPDSETKIEVRVRVSAFLL